MEKQAFEEMVRRYAAELMATAARSALPPQEPAVRAAETAPVVQTPPAVSAQTVRTETAQADDSRAEDTLTETARAETAQEETAQAEAQRAEAAQEAGEPETPGMSEEEGENPDVEINPPESGPGQDPLQPIPIELESYEGFLLQNPKKGELRIQATAGGRAVPIAGAEVTVSKTFTDGSQIFATAVTDASGIVDGIALPAPDKSQSQNPSGDAPYSVYTVTVSHPGYRSEIYTQVPIFDGIKSIQPVRLIPARPDFQQEVAS